MTPWISYANFTLRKLVLNEPVQLTEMFQLRNAFEDISS